MIGTKIAEVDMTFARIKHKVTRNVVSKGRQNIVFGVAMGHVSAVISTLHQPQRLVMCIFLIVYQVLTYQVYQVLT